MIRKIRGILFLTKLLLPRYSLLETIQARLRRVVEEANYFDAVLDSMNQVQTGLERLLAEITDFDAFGSQAERVDQELAVSHYILLPFRSPPCSKNYDVIITIRLNHQFSICCWISNWC